jgi:hypothetical protein
MESQISNLKFHSLIAAFLLLVASCALRAARIPMTPELSNSGVPQSSADILAGYYVAAADRLKQLVIHPTGLTAASKDWRQARAASMLFQIDRLIVQLKHKAAGWLGPNLTQAMLDGVKRANAQLKAIGQLPDGVAIAASLNQVDHGTLSVLARDSAGDLYKAADSLGKNAKAALRQTAQRDISERDINAILAGGIVEGQPRHTIQQLKAALEKVNGGKVTIIDKNGDPIDFDAGYYARLVVRTKTREATVRARHERLQQEGINLVSIVGRVSKNFCTAYLGMVFSLDGKSSKYPALDELPSGGPPFHPNCSKSTRPFIEDLATDRELDLAEGDDDTDKLVGMDAYQSQKAFKDLQIYQQVKDRYATTARRLFGK